MKILCFIFLLETVGGQSFDGALQECWHMEASLPRDLKFASDNQYLFFPLSEGVVKAVELKSGKIIWKSELGGEISSSLALDRDNLYVLSLGNELETESRTADLTADAVDEVAKVQEKAKESEKAKENTVIVSSLGSQTGITRWRIALSVNSPAKTYLLQTENRLYVILETGKIYVLDKQRGHVISTQSLKFNTLFAPLIKDGKIYVGDVTGKILEISVAESSTISVSAIKELKLIKNAPTAAYLTVNDLYIGDKTGLVYKLNISNGKVDWEARTGGEINGLVGVDKNLLVSSSDNFIYFLSKANGNRVWKKRLEGKNRGDSAVAGNVTVISPVGEKNALLIELKKGKTINQINLEQSRDNFLVGGSEIFGNIIILSTLQGFYAFGENKCAS